MYQKDDMYKELIEAHEGLSKEGNVWLSFPSSERNKVDEETYLILKKQHDNDIPVKTLNEYKILSIENEAPAFISQFQKTSTYAPGTLSSGDGVGPNFLSVVFTSAGIDGPELQSGRLITFEKGSSITESREINKVTNIGDVYTVTLREPLGPESTFLSPGDLVDINVVERHVRSFCFWLMYKMRTVQTKMTNAAHVE